MLLIPIAAIIAAVVFGALYFLLRKNIRNAAKDLYAINREADTNRQLRCSSPDKDLEYLLLQVNELLAVRQEDRVAFQSKERELRRQIANISHDLRTPLTSILGYTELLRAGEVSEEEKREYLEIIEKRARVLQTLIVSFYDLSRLEAGEYRLNLQPLLLYPMLCEIMVAFYKDLTDRGLMVDLQLAEKLPPVMGDEKAMTRVFSNLIQNALRHGSRQFTLTMKQEGRMAVLRFANDAPDMTEEDLAHVFERSYTGDKMRTGRDTGLGLTIAKQFVEQMDGWIAATLEDGVFCIEIRMKLLSPSESTNG